jgi:UDP-3-O-[3-hydroxymyristoyl] glucosamine N-acyltransferase
VSLTLGQIVEKLGGELIGSKEQIVNAIAPLNRAVEDEISFLSNPLYAQELDSTKAGCVILTKEQFELARSKGENPNLAFILSDKPYLYFAYLTQLWRTLNPIHSSVESPIHPTAVIDPTAVVQSGARVGPYCVVGAGAVIGERTWLKSTVNVAHGCKIGSDCILHPGVVIGADGFGFAPNQGTWVKIEQLGSVVIGNHVEIGANTCIDRGALGDTVIGDGVKLDNFIQIAHNVRIGPHTAMAAFVGVSGSTVIGAHCTVAGGAGFVGHIEIADRVNIGAKAVITRSITQAGNYGGYYPFDSDSAWKKNAAILRQLSTLRDKIKSLMGGSIK